MEPAQISDLAKLLRNNGDKILNSTFKLCLSGSHLCALNKSFDLIIDRNEQYPAPQAFQVTKINSFKSEMVLNLQFIYDFVQKTNFLCLRQFVNETPIYENEIDIRKFRSLNTLEIQRLPITKIYGLEQLRGQLKKIICCTKSMDRLMDLLIHCGGDKTLIDGNSIWNELKYADFSYNSLKTIDCGLDFVPNLEYLNLSHNQIISCLAIKWLKNLKILNLSYNRLTQVPQFNYETTKTLEILILKNNFIDDITGVASLTILNELDLSDNCLLDQSDLLPLSTLKKLKSLTLTGNLCVSLPNSRQSVVRYLHKNTSSDKFILDNQPLTKYEKTLTGQYLHYYATLTSNVNVYRDSDYRNNSRSSSTSRTIITPLKGNSQNDITTNSSFDSIKSFGNKYQQADTSITSPIKQQPKKLRAIDAFIADELQETDPIATLTNIKTTLNLGINKEHLETKKQIENLRNQYGDEWLHSQGSAQMVQSVIGIQNLPEKYHLTSEEDIIETILETINNNNNNNNIIKPDDNNSNREQIIKVDVHQVNDNLSTDDKNTTNSNTNESKSMYKSKFDNSELHNVYSQDESIESPIQISDSEDNEETYIVQLEPTGQDVLLIVSDVNIKEKDSITGRTKTRWNIKSLESCERLKSNVLRINFDTIKKDKKERIYKFDSECRELEQKLRDILSKRPLSEMNQTLYRCANCTTQFSRENIYKRQHIDVICPECKSTYVIEIKESPAPNSIEKSSIFAYPFINKLITKSNTSKTTEPTIITTIASEKDSSRASGTADKVRKSQSNSSIAPVLGAWRSSSNNILSSAVSLNDSSSCSKISKSESSFDSNQSVAGSSNCDRDTDFQLNRNNESDVEILSNPSQSSIEVLDGMNPSRKHSSEERRLIYTPSLDTISDKSLGGGGAGGSGTTGGDIGTNMMTNYLMSSINLMNQQPVTNEDKTDKKDDNVGEDNQLGISKKKMENGKSSNIITGVNLTESSSSGSVTDSVCTAYEHNLGNVNTDVSTNPDSPKKSTIQTNNQKSKNVSPPTDKGKNQKNDVSVISSMLGGLFQSTNLLMSRSSSKPDTNLTSTDESIDEFSYSYRDFDIVDHRIKLFLYQQIFEDFNEHFKWLVKGVILNEQQLELGLFDGIFVMSTTKAYFLQITKKECDDVSKWLHRHLAVTIDRIAVIRVLPWKIGITITVKGIGNLHLILQDIIRTDGLLLYFANNPLPNYCTLEYQVSEKLQQKLIKVTDNCSLNMLSVLKLCEISTTIPDEYQTSLKLQSLLVTETHLYLTSNFKWFLDNPIPISPKNSGQQSISDSNNNIVIAYNQLISNLISIDKIDENSFIIIFVDENIDQTEYWKCTFETSNCAGTTLNAITQIWENLFGVPLGD